MTATAGGQRRGLHPARIASRGQSVKVSPIEELFFFFSQNKSQKQDVYVTGCCIKPLCFLTAEAERKCVCRNASECPKDSAPLCVSSGDGSTHVTTTECEAGARRCAGEQVNVISIDPCQ